MQGGPSLRIGRIDRILNPLILFRACSQLVGENILVADVARVVGSRFLRVFPAPSIVVRAGKVLDRDTARIITRLEVGSGFEQPVHHVLPLGGIGQMQGGPPLVVRGVRIGPMVEKSLRALRPTFLDRPMQGRGAVPVADIEGRPGFDQTGQHFLASGFGGVMEGCGAGVVPGIQRRPGLDQEIAPATGCVVCRTMQGRRTLVVPGVHVGPRVNQGARHIEVGIPDGGPVQRGLAPPVAQVRIGPLLDEVADLMFGLSGGGAMQSRRAIEERVNEVFSPAHLIRLRLCRIGRREKLFLAHNVLDEGVESHPGGELVGCLERLAAGKAGVKFLLRRCNPDTFWHDRPPGSAVIVQTRPEAVSGRG